MSNRSGTKYSAPTDANRRPVVLGVSTADGITPVPLEVDPNTGQLQVSGGGGGGGSTQYTDGTSSPAHPIGDALVYSNGTNMLAVSSTNPLPVSATISGSGLATSSNQTSGSQKTQISDSSGNANTIKQLNNQVVATDYGIVTNSVIHGLTTGGGGGYVDVKVNPSGSLTVDASNSTGLVLGAGTAAIGSITNTSFTATQATGTNLHTVTDSGSVTNATLSAETTKVIGTVRAADGSGNLLTSTTNALDVNIKSGSIANTSFAVTQATASSLNATALISDGSNTLNVYNTANNATTTGGAALTAPTTVTYAYSYTAPTTGTTYDVGNYKSVSVQINTQYTTSTVNWFTSNDGTNFVQFNLTQTNSTAPTVSSTTSSIVYAGSLPGRYFRITVTGAYTSGTAAGVIMFSTAPYNSATTNSVSSTPVSYNSGTSATITTSSSTFSSSSASGYSAAEVSIHGTYAGIQFGITVSDDGGTTFYNVPLWDVQNNKYVAPGTTLAPADNSSASWIVPVSPATTIIKVLASAYTSGTGNIRITSSSTPLSIFSNATQASNSTSAAVPATALPAGYQARTSEITATTNAYNTIAVTDKVGKQIVLPYSNPENLKSSTGSATGTSSTQVVAAVASNSLYITSVSIMNTGITTTQVNLQDGSGGTTLMTMGAPAGGGSVLTFPSPLKTTSGNGLFFAAGAGSTTIYVSASGYYGVA